MSGPITADFCQTSLDCYNIVLEIGNWAAPKMRALQLTRHTNTIHVTIYRGLSSTLTCCITFQRSLWQEPCVSMQLFHEMKRTFWADEKRVSHLLYSHCSPSSSHRFFHSQSFSHIHLSHPFLSQLFFPSLSPSLPPSVADLRMDWFRQTCDSYS